MPCSFPSLFVQNRNPGLRNSALPFLVRVFFYFKSQVKDSGTEVGRQLRIFPGHFGNKIKIFMRILGENPRPLGGDEVRGYTTRKKLT